MAVDRGVMCPDRNTKLVRKENMKIEYYVSQNGLRIETYPKGVLDLKSTIDYFGKLQNDKTVKQGAIEIVYFKYVSDFKISYLEGTEITKSYQNPKSAQKIKATIFVCETDLAYGIGRMLQTFHEMTNPDHQVLVVKSESDIDNDEIDQMLNTNTNLQL